MHVAELWRFPVKSMAGERLERVAVEEEGIPGDRRVRVVDRGTGKVITARTKPRLLGLRATLAADGTALVEGRPWDVPESAAAVAEAAGERARLEPCAQGWDDTPLLVATDGAVAWMDVDGRRFRPNIVVGGVEGLDERGWEGRRLRIGEAEIDVPALRVRCAVTTIDPDTLEQDPAVLERINRELDGTLALDAHVARPGPIAVGDPVELL
jgi:uncharacterized protein YcbX